MDNPTIPVVIALIKNEQGQVLLGRRNDSEVIGADDKWELMGGKIAWDESPEQAVVREIKEETGLDVEVVRMLPQAVTNYWKRVDGTEFKVVLLPYECRIVGGELHTNEFDHKISELKFIDIADLKNYELLPFVRETEHPYLKLIANQ